MEIIAKSKYIRTSPRKMRLVADEVRHLDPQAALISLERLGKRAAGPLGKTIKTAIANAVNNADLKKEGLKIKKIEIGEGPTYKRYRAGSKGRANQILKRTSHIIVVLEGEK